MSNSQPAPGGESTEPLLSSLDTSTTSATELHHGLLHHTRHSHHDSTSIPINSSASSNPTGSKTGGLRFIPIRLIQFGISILLRIREALPARLRPWFWVGLWLAFAMVGVAFFAGFHARIFQFLETLATFIKGLGSAYGTWLFHPVLINGDVEK